MSLIKLAGYFGKEREGHHGHGAAIGAGLATLGAGYLGYKTHKGLKPMGGIKGLLAKGNVPTPFTGTSVTPGQVKGVLAGMAGTGIAAGAGVGAGIGGLIRTKKDK